MVELKDNAPLFEKLFSCFADGEDVGERPDVSKQAVINTPAPKSAEQSIADKSSPSSSGQQDSPETGVTFTLNPVFPTPQPVQPIITLYVLTVSVIGRNKDPASNEHKAMYGSTLHLYIQLVRWTLKAKEIETQDF